MQNGKIIQLCIDNWIDLKKIFSILDGYWFRGQENSSWDITSSIERLAISEVIPYVDLHAREKDVIEAIKRKKHLLDLNIPDDNDVLGWLSIIRHYGGPTRLIDFSYSPYIAAFFAVTKMTSNSAIWALGEKTPLVKLMFNYEDFPKSLYGYERRDALNELGNKIISGPSIQQTLGRGKEFVQNMEYIFDVSPIDFTNRISNQQGLFIMQTALEIPFMENLQKTYSLNEEQIIIHSISDFESCFYDNDDMESVENVYKIIIPMKMRYEIVRDLELMNISYNMLYPDIEGFIMQLYLTFEMEYKRKT